MTICNAIELDLENTIRTRPEPVCCLCGSEGGLLYQGLEDRLFGVSGKWDFRKCTDPSCGLVWLDPMPVKEDLGKLYADYHTHEDLPRRDSWMRRLYRQAISGYLNRRYGYKTIGTGRLDHVLGWLLSRHPGRRADADAKVMYLAARNGGRVLEVGCGDGTTLRKLKSLGWEVEGVDFDPSAVMNARRKGLTVHVGDVAGIKGDGSFDAIIASHVIEHVPNPVAMLKDCYRLLKPGGIIVGITPNVESLGHRFFKADWRGLEPPRHLHTFTLRALENTACRAGFSDVVCSATGRARGILRESSILKRNEKVDRKRRLTLAERFRYESVELFEWFMQKIDRTAGEEILLLAKKSA